MMPATCVPWPKPSPAVAAPGEVTTLATTREPPCASLKSGMSTGDAGVDDGDADTAAGDAALPQLVGARGLRVADVASWLASRPVLRTRLLSVRPVDMRVTREDLGLLGRQLDGEAVDERDLPVILPPWARTILPAAFSEKVGLNCTMAVTVAVRGLLGRRREARLRRGGRLGHRLTGCERNDRRHSGERQPATPALVRGVEQFQGTSLCHFRYES